MVICTVSICAGIGGLDRAIARVFPASRVVLYVERELSAAAVLAARMESQDLDAAPIWSDLGTLTGPECRAYLREAAPGGIDILCGGIPCQPHSVAGKRKGADDERDLWPVTLAAIELYKPGLVIIENVPGILGYVSARIVPDLRRAGYVVPRPVLLEASAVGASQKRERLFLMACRSSGIREWGVPEPNGRHNAADADGGDGGVERPSGKQGKRRRRSGNVAGESGSAEGEACQRQRGGDASDGDGDPVGRTDRARRKTAGSGSRIDERLQSPSPSRDIFGPFPPGPGLGLDRVVDKVRELLESGDVHEGRARFLAELGEWAKWQRILEVRPDLAPATVECEIHNLVDGTAGKLDISRADQLRALGNGVVSDCAEAAIRILLRRLEIVGE